MRSGGWFAPITAIVAAVAGVGMFLLFSLSGGGTQHVYTPTVDRDAVAPVVVQMPNLTSREGMAHFFAKYRAKFGDAIADDVTLHPGHGSVTRPVQGQLNRLEAYDFRGGFSRSRDITTRKVGTPTIDLAILNLDAIGAALVAAPTTVKVPDGSISHVMIEADRGPVVRIYVRNKFDESGYLEVGPTGQVGRVSEFKK